MIAVIFSFLPPRNETFFNVECGVRKGFLSDDDSDRNIFHSPFQLKKRQNKVSNAIK